MHKRIVRFSRWVRFLITRFTQIDIVSSRATGNYWESRRGRRERKSEAEGAPLKPHFRRIDFQVLSHEREKLVYATRNVLISCHMASRPEFPRRSQYNINLSDVHIFFCNYLPFVTMYPINLILRIANKVA